MKIVAAIGSRPIRAHHSSHVHASFLYGIELCYIRCKKLVQEKSCTRNHVRRSIFLYKSTCTSFLTVVINISWASQACSIYYTLHDWSRLIKQRPHHARIAPAATAACVTMHEVKVVGLITSSLWLDMSTCVCCRWLTACHLMSRVKSSPTEFIEERCCATA